MLRKLLSSSVGFLLVFLVAAAGSFAQTGTVQGTLTDSQTSEVLPGANVFIQELGRGSATNQNGEFTVEEVPYGEYQIRFSYVGYETITRSVMVDEDVVTVNVSLQPSERALDEVVVTAYGIEQTQNELSYSAQKVDGDIIEQSQSDDFMNALSGRVAGLKVTDANSMGGSTNIVMRGYKSITGNNQVLIVVDGVPYANNEFSHAHLKENFYGYDYGSTGVDINPENIQSVNVLKGPAAAALYGSRASNGAIVIQTKSGTSGQRNVNVTLQSGVTVSSMDKSTFPDYQMEYGGGYGPFYSSGSNPYFIEEDVNGDGTDDLVVPHTADASFGPEYDPNLMVYQWDAFAEDGPNYLTPTPWTPADNTPVDFFETGVSAKNSIMIDGGFDNGYYTLNYNMNNTTGILPNSSLDKYKLDFSAGYDISDDLNVSAKVSYARTDGKGRPAMGYGAIFSQFRQWWATNVDVKQQRAAYFRNEANNTWNWAADREGPIYWDNIYWTRYENYQTDQRDRYFGYAEATYDAFDWLSFTGRVSVDSYAQLTEERFNRGSIGIPYYFSGNGGYRQGKETFAEFNYDLLANYNAQLTEGIGVSGVVGMNIRRVNAQGYQAQTNGGLVVPRLYSLANSISSIEFPTETDRTLGVNGYFASLNVNYNDFLNLELTGRRDKSSSLPEGENVYYYPSASLGFVFSEFIDADWLSFGKIRGSVASVGNTAPPYSVLDTYARGTNFGSAGLYSNPNRKNNADLKPERTKSWEVGLQMSFLNDRLSYDINYYDQNTLDQIIPIEVSRSTGFASKFVNAGNVENRGIEVTLTGRPVVKQDFIWTVTANWNRNINKVKELAPGIQNFQLASPQGDVTISAALGEPYGALRGSDFIYTDGERTVDPSTGFYMRTSSSNNIIGNMNPDWTGGLSNRFNYKNWTLNVLVDVRWGGDIFSLDQYYGQGTGLYPITAGTNDKGNPKRDPVSEGGGVLLDGVNPDGSENSTYATVQHYAGAYGWINNPTARYVYDGSYVKLREVGITYDLPQSLVNKLGIVRSASFSVVGRNLWIIHKNLPHSDPEQTVVAGNVQGYQGAAHPSTRDVTFNLKLEF